MTIALITAGLVTAAAAAITVITRAYLTELDAARSAWLDDVTQEGA